MDRLDRRDGTDAQARNECGGARRKLSGVASEEEEARLKAAGTYGGNAYTPASKAPVLRRHQHFGPLIVSCELEICDRCRTASSCMATNGASVSNSKAPVVPRAEVIDELMGAVHGGIAPLHDGTWARGTLEICLAMLRSSAEQRDVLIGGARSITEEH